MDGLWRKTLIKMDDLGVPLFLETSHFKLFVIAANTSAPENSSFPAPQWQLPGFAEQIGLGVVASKGVKHRETWKGYLE